MSIRSYCIFSVLEQIRKRPGVYIGEETLDSLMTYIGGYVGAMRDAKIPSSSQPYFGDFHEFVRAKFGYRESTAGWANMILAVEIGLEPKKIRWENYSQHVSREQHKASIKTFYELLDEFRQNT